MNQQSQRQIQERVTSRSIPDVLNSAVEFFARRGGIYAAYPEKRGPTHVALRGQGNEEVVIAARPVPGGTAVTGSSYLFDQQISQFLALLPPPNPVEPEPTTDSADAVVPSAELVA